MRRYLAAALLLAMVSQSSGAAMASTATDISGSASLRSVVESTEMALTGSLLFAAMTGTLDRYEAMHAKAPEIQRPVRHFDAAQSMRPTHALVPRARLGTRDTIGLPSRSELDPRHHRLDPLAMRKSPVKSVSPASSVQPLLSPLSTLSVGRPGPRSHTMGSHKAGGGVKQSTASAGTTGIEPWWTYEERSIPGVGKAMLNVGTGNLVVAATDVDIHEQGIDLAFQRVYNTQSLHDYNGDDGGDPAIFGNRWTNNFDANIVYSADAQTITVYDIDGAACTYTANAGSWIPCAGEYATLAPTDSTDCTYAWTKTNGTQYLFHTDESNSGCGITQAKIGHLQAIFARNLNNYINFAYSYSGLPKDSEHVTEIDANHSDGHTLKMIFGLIPGTTINELQSIVRPDSATLQYSYDSNGNLLEVDKPGNNSATSVPNGHNVPAGDAPETYAYSSGTSTLQQVCGPRCTVATWNNPGNPTDGAALDFTTDGSLRTTGWQVNGILNFTPSDGTGTNPLQPSLPTTFQTWYTANFVYGQGSACTSTANGTTTMCDTDGHSSQWTTNLSYNVTQTQAWTGGTNITALVTSQSWDSANDLISTTDANGNTTTYTYDTGGYNAGNLVEVLEPNANDIGVGLMPLTFYSYDDNHNILASCDPVWTSGNHKVWKANPGDSLCPGGANTTTLTYQKFDTAEPFGCLTNIQKPRGYTTTIEYSGSGPCGSGLPVNTTGTTIAQPNTQPSRTPTQDLGYDSFGNLSTYDKGQGQGGAYQDSWSLTYDTENELQQQTEHDGTIGLTGSSFTCYYLDGAVFYTETPSQHVADNNLPCPTLTQLESGSLTPPAYATAYYYDLDGDRVQMVTSKGCSGTAPTCVGSADDNCNGSLVTQSPLGTTCRYYDGLDRLVEVAQPYDARHFPTGGGPIEFYGFRWMNRYIYDLSQSGGAANLSISDSTGTISGIVAYGNLYKTQEYLPSSKHIDVTKTYSSASWSDVRGNSFDALSRTVGKYELAFSASAATIVNTYDINGDLGLLARTVNAMGQQENMIYDSANRIKQIIVTGSNPAIPRSYTYDPDGRTASITDNSANSLGTISYTYDTDGNLASVAEPQNQVAASLICYDSYGDGLREDVSIGTLSETCGSISYKNLGSGISQPDILNYAYRNDGRLANEQVDWGTVQDTFSWLYYPSGREESETDPLTNQSVNGITFTQKTYNYDNYGRVSKTTLPEGWTETQFAYDYDDEPLGYSFPSGGQTYARQYLLDVRGELLLDGTNDSNLPMIQAGARYPNGTQTGNGQQVINGFDTAGPPSTQDFDARSGQVLQIQNPEWPQTAGQGNWDYSYDAVGRQVQVVDSNNSSTGNTTFDTENHILTTSAPDNGGQTATVGWGPDGHERNSGGISAHWDGDNILFAGKTLYIGKLAVMDSSGDLYIADRDQTGAQQTSHGTYSGGLWYDGWDFGTVRNAYEYKNNASVIFQFDQGSCTYGGASPPQTTCPNFVPPYAMTRSDGYTMVGGINQGDRTYDPTSGQWATPDAYAGDVSDPLSQKPFIWNGNNPVIYSDPSGFDFVPDEWIPPNNGQPECDDCLAVAGCQGKYDACYNGVAYQAGAVLPITDSNKYPSPAATGKALDAETSAVVLGEFGELGSGINCNDGSCIHGDISVGGNENGHPTVYADIVIASDGTAYLWHEHQPGATEQDAYGHNENSNDLHFQYSKLKLLYIYTEYQNRLYLQEYGKYTPVDQPKWPVPVP